MSGHWLISLLLAAAVGGPPGHPATATPADDYANYQVIIERSPFGPVSGATANGPQPSFADRFTFVGLVPSLVNTQMLAVIQDREHNRAELRAEGDWIDDVKVVNIEVAPTPKLVLQRGLEVATLNYQPRNASPAAPGVPPRMMPQPGYQGAPMPLPPGSPIRRRIPFRRGQ